MTASVLERPLRYARIESSNMSIRSRVLDSIFPTVVSRMESKACRMEIGRLSVVPGLSMRTLPHVLSLVGRIRDARIICRSVVVCWSQHLGMRAKTLIVKLFIRAFEGVGLAVSSSSGRGPEKDVTLVCGLWVKLNGHLYAAGG